MSKNFRRLNYIELENSKTLFDSIWDISRFIFNNKKISMIYSKQNDVRNEYIISPVSIMFSEFYFYMIGYIDGKRKDYPAIFRIDRIDEYKETGERFKIPYRDRFNDGEFRKRIQFMYAGPLKRIRILFDGDSLEAILDRFPTAEIISRESNNKALVDIEGFGHGIEMWLKSQGSFVEIIECKSI